MFNGVGELEIVIIGTAVHLIKSSDVNALGINPAVSFQSFSLLSKVKHPIVGKKTSLVKLKALRVP
jgi:hypothetical protein